MAEDESDEGLQERERERALSNPNACCKFAVVNISYAFRVFVLSSLILEQRKVKSIKVIGPPQ